MTIKYYCFKSTADEGGVSSGLNGYVYFPTEIVEKNTQALVAGSIGELATSETELVPLTLDGTAVLAGAVADGLPTTLVCKTFITWSTVAQLERFAEGDITEGGGEQETTNNTALGSEKVIKIYLGTNEVLRIYLGEKLIFGK